jgi:SAM-dependent methyltransferase
MSDAWLNKWNEKYKDTSFAFGKAPNIYLKEQLEKLRPGSVLFAAEGEGRNAVFAAQLGWQVSAFDISIVGRNKALQLCGEAQVTIDYQVGELPLLNYRQDQFDVLVLIYAHFPAQIKSTYHRVLGTYVRPGGAVIFEAFSKKHLDYVTKNPSVGGPSDIESLFSIEEVKSDFENFEIIELAEKEIELSEGHAHIGFGSVVRFIGKKKD